MIVIRLYVYVVIDCYTIVGRRDIARRAFISIEIKPPPQNFPIGDARQSNYESRYIVADVKPLTGFSFRGKNSFFIDMDALQAICFK